MTRYKRLMVAAAIATIVGTVVAVASWTSHTQRNSVASDNSGGINVGGSNNGSITLNGAGSPLDSPNPCIKVTALGYKCSADSLAEAISVGNLPVIKLIIDGGVGLDAPGEWNDIQGSLMSASRRIQIATLSEMKNHGLTIEGQKPCVIEVWDPVERSTTVRSRAGCALATGKQGLYCAFRAIGFDDSILVEKLIASRKYAAIQAAADYRSRADTRRCNSVGNIFPSDSGEVKQLKERCIQDPGCVAFERQSCREDALVFTDKYHTIQNYVSEVLSRFNYDTRCSSQ